jgi:hypothetical protein
MKINVTFTDEMIRDLIMKDIENKLNYDVLKKPKIDIKVRSKQNYREKEFEVGELKCEIEIEI